MTLSIDLGASDRASDGLSRARLRDAIARASDALFARQRPAGYWWAELQSNVSITAEVILLHHVWGRFDNVPHARAEHYLRSEQRAHGGWELAYGDGGELSVSIEAYLALRMLGVPAADPALTRARAFILARGGIARSRVFTKMHLALVGAFPWSGLPSLPPWLMLLPAAGPFSIYDLSSWARGSTVPLIILFDRKPLYGPSVKLHELYAEDSEDAPLATSPPDPLARLFERLDRVFAAMERAGCVPFRERGLRPCRALDGRAARSDGRLGRHHPRDAQRDAGAARARLRPLDPVVVRGWAAIEAFSIVDAEGYRVQPCISPVWDTALAVRARRRGNPARRSAPAARGGLAAREADRLALRRLGDEEPHREARRLGLRVRERVVSRRRRQRGRRDGAGGGRIPRSRARARRIGTRQRAWIASMQCRTGGWGAFDVDNDKTWLNRVPYGDLRAMVDPSNGRRHRARARDGRARRPATRNGVLRTRSRVSARRART
jgi:squalene-hopene/tetraprenyl-beta-curcumene cyclase